MENQGFTAYDAVIVGAGAAGISAALWCAELGLSALLVDAAPEPGGQLLWTYNEIRNHLGTEAAANGRELRDLFWRQAAGRGFDRRFGARVEAVDFERREVAFAGGARAVYRALVIATGIRRRRLGVAGEEEFRGRGLIDSGARRAEAVAGRRAVIVGGGDAALENALILGERAAAVTLVHRRGEFRARPEFVAAAAAHPRVTIRRGCAVTALGGGAALEWVAIEDLAGGAREVVPADVLLVRIGVEPNTAPFGDRLARDRDGYIEVARDGATSVAGVYAAGDVANPLAPTVSTAVGTGAAVAKAIYAFLNYGPKL